MLTKLFYWIKSLFFGFLAVYLIFVIHLMITSDIDRSFYEAIFSEILFISSVIGSIVGITTGVILNLIKKKKKRKSILDIWNSSNKKYDFHRGDYNFYRVSKLREEKGFEESNVIKVINNLCYEKRDFPFKAISQIKHTYRVDTQTIKEKPDEIEILRSPNNYLIFLLCLGILYFNIYSIRKLRKK
jgi:hypothetical protein